MLPMTNILLFMTDENVDTLGCEDWFVYIHNCLGYEYRERMEQKLVSMDLFNRFEADEKQIQQHAALTFNLFISQEPFKKDPAPASIT